MPDHGPFTNHKRLILNLITLWQHTRLISRRKALQEKRDDLKAKIAELQLQNEKFLVDGTYGAIGRSVRNWAGLEIGLDLTNGLLMNLLEADQKEAFPVSLKRKLRFYRAKHRIVFSGFPEIIESSALIADEIGNMSRRRHAMVHGYAMGDFTQLITTWRLHEYNQSELIELDVSYSMEDFSALSVDIGRLSVKVMKHAKAVHEQGRLILNSSISEANSR